jgi:ABC-2 type transport system permease protein
MPFEIRAHARANPAAESRLNIVPGLVGTILTMTMLIFTALSVTREIERGTMENLLAMPITPVEVMLGKIIPMCWWGFASNHHYRHRVLPVSGAYSWQPHPACGALDTVHRSKSIDRLHILDDCAEPASGHADVDDVLPAEHSSVRLYVSVRWNARLGAADRGGAALTHYIRIVRAIMLKGASLQNLQYDAIALCVLMLIAMTIAVTRFRRTLD